MTVYKKEFIDKLLLPENNIGAGNFFNIIHDNDHDHDRVVFVLDKPISLPSGKKTTTLSLGEINAAVDSYSSWYQSQGITPKDPVALVLTDTIDYFIHFLALTQIGAIPVIINEKLSEDIVLQFVLNVGAVMLLGTQANIRIFKPLLNFVKSKIKTECIEEIRPPKDWDIQAYRHTANDPVLLGHTSGTTGTPKAVQFNHEGFFFGVQQQIHKQVGNRILSALPHSHASAISILMSALLRGALIKVQSKKSPEELFLAIAEFRPDFFVSFPKTYVDMCHYNLEEYDLSSISYWLSTGDSNHERHIKKLISQGSHFYKEKIKKGSIFIDNLGSSEFGFAIFRNIHRPDTDRFDRCIGSPFEWVEAVVLSKNGELMPDGEIGLLGVKSKTVTAGYWNNTLLSEKNKLAGYWLTGDLVFRRDKNVFFHVDRTTDPIHTAKGVIYSCQVEELILKNFPEIFDCSLVGVDNGSGSQNPVLIVEGSDSDQDGKLLSRINDFLRKRDDPEILRIIVKNINEDIGVTGKVLKRVARSKYASSEQVSVP
jgi:long-chain acyl-CoA synthetase